MGSDQSRTASQENVDCIMAAQPTISRHRIEQVLRRTRGNVRQAMQILMTQRERVTEVRVQQEQSANAAHSLPSHTTNTTTQNETTRPRVRFYQLLPPIQVKQFIEQPTTVFRLISYPACAYFQHSSNIRDASQKEYILADARLQYAELLSLDGIAEIKFTSDEEGDTFWACPVVEPNGSSSLSWVCDDFGWINVPPANEDGLFPIGNDWWLGLKYSLDSKMRSLLQFQLFEKRMLRLFTVPMETEQYTRVIATTNASVMLRELEKDPQGVCGRLLAHQLMACPGGDWVGTMVAFQHSNVASDRPIGSDTGVPVGLTDRISVIESVTSECTDVKSKHLARQYSQDISGCPLPVAVRQSYASAGSQPSATHLFPHQLNTLQWMLDVEEGRSEVLRVPQAAVFHGWFAYSHGMEKDMLPGDIEILESSSLALGGLVAHPVGSGKTVIAIELVKVTASSGTTVICVPGHIADQWRQEIARFAPTLSCIVVNNKSSLANLRGVAAVIIPYDVFQSPLLLDTFCLMRWRRVIFDEPQDIVKKEYFDQLAFGLHCPYRWLLSATPNPMQDMIQLALGYKPDGRLPLESIHKWFIRTRCRRDSPSMCLPVPPLHVHMLPVTLTWQETVVAHMHAMADHLQASIRLCSYFANVDIRGNISESNEARTDAAGHEPVLLGVRRFSSLDDWIVSHRQELQDELDHIQSNLHHITLLVRQQYHQFQQHLEAIPIVSDQESDVVNSDDHFDQEAMEVMFDEHSGVDPELVSRRQELIREAKKRERLLRFMESVCQTISSEMECTICMERLGLSIITMLPCLHSFCAICVINLFGDLQTASCPVCRSEAQRRELCTFRCNDQATDDVWISTGLLSDDPESPHFRGSKLWTLAREVGRVLDEHPDDKVLIFAQWDELLRQISLILPTDNCLLVGSMDVRCRLIENFQRNPTPRVLLLSLDQQVSGANLDVANHVFVVHPYCPASVASTASVPLAQAQAYEQQAVGRVLRFPQLKDVHLYRLYARGTVEEELYMHWGWA